MNSATRGPQRCRLIAAAAEIAEAPMPAAPRLSDRATASSRSGAANIRIAFTARSALRPDRSREGGTPARNTSKKSLRPSRITSQTSAAPPLVDLPPRSRRGSSGRQRFSSTQARIARVRQPISARLAAKAVAVSASAAIFSRADGVIAAARQARTAASPC